MDFTYNTAECAPLAQIRREQKKPGPLLLVYFMGVSIIGAIGHYTYSLFLYFYYFLTIFCVTQCMMAVRVNVLRQSVVI